MADGNSIINLGDLAQPVTLLIEKISNAIGVVYEPTKIKRNAKAEAEAHRTMVLADLDLQSEVANRGFQRLITQQTRKQINIENIIQQSIEELPDNAEVEKLDEDWLANFFDKCENISNEKMQTMWSKILTNEATKPRSFSKRTIDIVSNMDKKDAETFTRFCQFVWNLGIPVPIIFEADNYEILADNNMSLETLNHLQSIGLITMSLPIRYTRCKLPKKTIYAYFDKFMEFEFTKEEDNEFEVGNYLLTNAGIELFKVCNPQPNSKYLENIVSIYRDRGIIITDIDQTL